MAATLWKEYKTVRVEKEDGTTWCILNRPEKRNAMNPQLHYDMLEALTELEKDTVLTDSLGEMTCEAFMRAKWEEWDQFRLRVSDYEIERYLETA